MGVAQTVGGREHAGMHVVMLGCCSWSSMLEGASAL